VYFVKYYDKGSTDIAGHQVSDALSQIGVESAVIRDADLADVSDAILVFIKTSRWHHLVAARRRRNKLVLDVQDTLAFKRRIKNAWAYDGVIFRNARALKDFGSPKRLDRVIRQHWDLRYQPNDVQRRELRIGYFGLERSLRLWRRIPGVDYFSPGGDRFPDDYFRHAAGYNCHVSIRQSGRESLYKPNNKVSTAAACEANLVTTADESAVELLGADYPYFTEPDLPSVLSAIQKVHDTFGSTTWTAALDRMRLVKEKTSIGRIRDETIRYFNELG
jgi:hypothetical protein